MPGELQQGSGSYGGCYDFPVDCAVIPIQRVTVFTVSEQWGVLLLSLLAMVDGAESSAAHRPRLFGNKHIVGVLAQLGILCRSKYGNSVDCDNECVFGLW